MKVNIYIEGASDKFAMEALLAPLLEKKLQEGIAIEFFETPSGDRKKSVLTKVPQKAVNILRNNPDSIVIAMPDLYPKNKAFPHETIDELVAGISQNFEIALRDKGLQNDNRLRERFKVFCFKYELEALILAAEVALQNRLGINSINRTWRIPVEDQNHDNPPKQIVEQLFKNCGKRYQETVDVPLILGSVSYQEIADKCTQCFKPFVEFIEGLQAGNL